MKKLFIVVNLDTFLLSHRKEIAVGAKKDDFDVTIIAKDTGKRNEIHNLGLGFIDLPMNKAGSNLKEELKTFLFLYNLYRKECPDIVHHVGLKIVLWGGLAAKLLRIPGVVNAICGLGILFSESRRNSLLTKTILQFYRFTHRRKKLTDIFQNNDDKALFLSERIVDDKQCAMTNGSGIDLTEYCFTNLPLADKVRILFTARMVEDKGVLVLIEAAKQLKQECKGKVEFLLAGGLDTNPNGIKEETLRSLCDGKYICWLGFRTDIKKLLQSSHIVAYPSWYREGIPRSLIEATAIGRAIVTTDSVGCRETVIDGYNGFLVPVKDSTILAKKLNILIQDKELCRRFGENSRNMGEQKFSVKDVVRIHLSIYEKLSQN